MAGQNPGRDRRSGRGPTRRRTLRALGAGGVAALVGTQGVHATGTDPGEVLWRFETDKERVTSPTVVGGSVFVGSSLWSARESGGTVHALNAETGEERWRVETIYNVHAPALVDDTVFVAGGEILALDPATGEKRWESASDRGFSSPVVADGNVYVHSGSGPLKSYNVGTGHTREDFEGKIYRAPAVVNGTLYTPTYPDDIVAQDGESGDELWRIALDECHLTSPTVADNTVFVGTTDHMCGERAVLAIDADSGETRWHTKIDRDNRSPPTVARNTVYLGAGGVDRETDDELVSDGCVYALDAVTGAERWHVETDERVSSSPTVADGTVIAGSHGGDVFAFDADTGAKRWQSKIDGALIGSPIVVDGVVYIGSADGSVYALDAGTEGSSEDSRVLLGTEGHHHAYAESAAVEYDPDEFVLEIDVEPEPAVLEEMVHVTITVENVGDIRGMRVYEFSGEAIGFQRDEVTLAGGERTTFEFNGTVDPGFQGTREKITVRASVWEDETKVTVSVEEPNDEPTGIDRLPGFGAVGGLGGIAGAGYLLNRRLGGRTDD